MAQLTWRELQAPDLSSSLRGYQQFSALLDSALGKAQGTVDRINNGMDERANTGALRIAAAVQDPEQAKALLADPRLMTNRLNAQTISALASRPTQLIAQAGAEASLADVKRNQSQTIANDALSADLARGYELRAAEGAGSLNDQGRAELRDINARIQAAAGSVGSKNTVSNMVTLDAAETGGLGRAENRLGMDNTRLGMKQTEQNMRFAEQNQQWTADDRAAVELGDAGFLKVQESIIPGSRESAAAAFYSPEIQKLPPKARMAAFEKINQFVGGLFQSDEMANMSGYSGGGGGVPDLANSESGGNWGALNNEGYGGRLQFGDSRLADAANAGLVPKGTTGAQFSKMSPAQQQKVEQWHFQDVDKQAGNLGVTRYIGQTVAGVPITRDSIRAMAHLGGVAGVKKFVESGGKYNPADSNGTKLSDYGRRFAGSSASQYGTQAGAALRVGQDRAGKANAGKLIEAATTGPTNPLDAADQIKANPRFADTSREFIVSQINDIVRRGKGNITVGQAAVIFSEAARENNNSWGITNWATGNSVKINKAGDRLNNTFIQNEIDRAANGGVVGDSVREQDIAISLQGLEQAKASLGTAREQYQNALRLQATRPAVAAQLPRLKAQMDAANAALIASQASAEGLAAPRSAVAQTTGSDHWYTGLFNIRSTN